VTGETFICTGLPLFPATNPVANLVATLVALAVAPLGWLDVIHDINRYIQKVKTTSNLQGQNKF